MTTPSRPLSVRLADATRRSHRAAERAGFMPALMRGEIAQTTYVLFLRNLHALYDALERALDAHAVATRLEPMRLRALYRTGVLALDLDHLAPRWSTLPLAAATLSYIARIDSLVHSNPSLLVAHAYVRYMGDLSGGQILRNVVRRALALGDERGTAFYAFGSSAPDLLKVEFRRGLDAIVVEVAGADAILAEADAAFARHIALFEELALIAGDPARA